MAKPVASAAYPASSGVSWVAGRRSNTLSDRAFDLASYAFLILAVLVLSCLANVAYEAI